MNIHVALLNVLEMTRINIKQKKIKKQTHLSPPTGSSRMKLAFRNAFYTFSTSRFFLNPNPKIPLLPIAIRTVPTFHETFRSLSATLCSATMEGGEAHAPLSSSPSLEKQFEGFRVQLDESGNLRERIRAVVMEIESTTRLMYASLLLVHQSRPTTGKENCFFFFGEFIEFYDLFFIFFLKQRFWKSQKLRLVCWRRGTSNSLKFLVITLLSITGNGGDPSS